MAIKSSGVPYQELSPEKIVIVDLKGNVAEGDLNLSFDTPTHLELYKTFKDIGGVVHTHSMWATAWAGGKIPCYRTTQADYFYGSVPCARALTKEEVEFDYEFNTGRVIVEKFKINRSYCCVRSPLQEPWSIQLGQRPERSNIPC